MKDIKPLVEKFYETGKWEDDIEGKIKSFIRNFVISKKLEKGIKRILGDDYVEEIYSLFILKLLKNKDLLLSKKSISFSYLISIVKNVIFDFYRKRAMNFEVSVQSLHYSYEEGNLEEVIFKQEPPEYYPIEVYELFNKILKIFDEKDKETLCYYLFKQFGEEFKVKSLSKDALYKRWERLKKKLRENFGEINLELWTAFVELYVSEVCKKLR